MQKKNSHLTVSFPSIKVFPFAVDPDADLMEQAKKILEEAAEIFSAVEEAENIEESGTGIGYWHTEQVLEECCDCVQAVSNMAAMIYTKGVKRRIGRDAVDMIRDLNLDEYYGKVYGKNYRRGYYNETNPDIGNCIDKDGDY